MNPEHTGVYGNAPARARDDSAAKAANGVNFKGPVSRCQDAEFLESAEYARRVLAGEVLVYRVRLDVARICTFKCPFCFAALDRITTGRLAKQSIPLPLIRDLTAQFTRLGVRFVNLYGGGEPTLHPQFSDILQQLAEASIHIRIITNGSGLTPTVCEAIKRHHRWIDAVRISFPGISQESHRQISGTDSFERISASVAELARAMKTLPDPTEIGLYVPVTMEYSEKEIESFVEYAASAGAAWVFFREDTRFTGAPDDGQNSRSFPAVRQKVQTVAERFEGFAVYYTTPVAVPNRTRICYFQLTDLALVFDPTTQRLVMVRCEHDIPGGLSDLPAECRYELIEASDLYAVCERQLREFRSAKQLACPRPDYCLTHRRNEACERILEDHGMGPDNVNVHDSAWPAQR